MTKLLGYCISYSAHRVAASVERKKLASILSNGSVQLTNIFRVIYMRFIVTVMVMLASFSSMAKPLSYYFEQQVEFDSSIPTPEEVLGYQVGEWHVRHDQLVRYMEILAQKSDRINFEVIGRTHEQRPLVMLTITAADKLKNIEQTRQAHLARLNNKKNNQTKQPGVVWMGYSVHGNESSGSNTALLVAYYLAAAQGDEINNLLNNTVILLDPSLNPDGLARFANWANSNRGMNLSSDPQTREHVEAWPSSRTNHYWFDLNRDWAWATQIESQQRIQIYNKWMPHIHVDFHEQGINNPYYFAPAAEPFHEVITDWQRNFQTQIGKNHAKYFDEKGWLYFTRESFDLLYPSYGDTYPTFMGAIGMTYEQAGHGRAGLGIETDHRALLTLVDRVAHHKTTGLSTVEIASQNVKKLNTEFKKFFKNEDHTYKSYVLKNDNEDKINRLKKLLDRHEIKYQFTTNSRIKGYNYQTQKEERVDISKGDLVVHTNQPKGKMVKVLFEPNAKLADSLTYDITAWSIPYAYGLNTIASKSEVSESAVLPKENILNSIDNNAYAYISKWNSINDATFLGELLQNNIHVRFTTKTTIVEGKTFLPGSLIILKLDNKKEANYASKVVQIGNNHQRKLVSVATGFSDNGVDFGSSSVQSINKQRVAVLSGEGTSSLSFGEIWHFFETQLKYPLTVLATDYFKRVNLDEFDVLIIPQGYYTSILDKTTLKKVKAFAKNGGTVIAIGNAAASFADQEGFGLKTKEPAEIEDEETSKEDVLLPYSSRERNSVANLITGSIFKSKVDTTHPLAFGYTKEYFSLKLSEKSYAYLENGTNVAYFYKEATNVSGYAGSKALENVPESLLFGEDRMGSGTVIYMIDNPLFRSFWENGKLFIANAVFLVNSDEMRR